MVLARLLSFRISYGHCMYEYVEPRIRTTVCWLLVIRVVGFYVMRVDMDL